MRKLDQVIYDINDDLPLSKLVLVSLNYVIKFLPLSVSLPLFFGGLIQLDGNQIANLMSITLIVAAITAFLQANRKVGPGILAPANFCVPLFAASIAAITKDGLSLVCGMTIISGFFQIILTPILTRARFLFNEKFASFIVFIMGVWLASLGVSEIFQPSQLGQLILHSHFNVISSVKSGVDTKYMTAGFISLFTMLGICIWSPGKYRMYSLWIGMLAGWICAYILKLIPDSVISQAIQEPWFYMPTISMQSISFDKSLLPAFLLAGLIMLFMVYGSVVAIQNTSEEKQDIKVRDKQIQSCNFITGLSLVIAGLVGGIGQAIEPGTVSTTLVTGVLARKIGYVYSAILCVLAFCPKVVSILLTMPAAVNGAAIIFLGSNLFAKGLKIFGYEQESKYHRFVFSFAVIAALSVISLPELYELIRNTYWHVTQIDMVCGVIVYIVFAILTSLKRKNKE